MAEVTVHEIRVKVGQPIRVDVLVSGSPVPVVSWKKDYRYLSPSARVRIGRLS